jgi:hypothetical protein
MLVDQRKRHATDAAFRTHRIRAERPKTDRDEMSARLHFQGVGPSIQVIIPLAQTKLTCLPN